MGHWRIMSRRARQQMLTEPACRRDGLPQRLAPSSQETPDHDELAEVERVVVGQEEGLAQVGLPLTVWNGGEWIERRVGHEGSKRRPIRSKGRCALVPRRGGWRHRRRRPVRGGPLRFGVCRIPAEIEDVSLSEPDVLEQLPERVRESRGLDAEEPRGQASHDLIEGDVSIVPLEEREDVTAECGGLGHEVSLSPEAEDQTRTPAPRGCLPLVCRCSAGDARPGASVGTTRAA